MIGPSLAVARLHFLVFFAGRVLHSIAYLFALRAPTRSLAYTFAQIPCVSMAVQILMAVAAYAWMPTNEGRPVTCVRKKQEEDTRAASWEGAHKTQECQWLCNIRCVITPQLRFVRFCQYFCNCFIYNAELWQCLKSYLKLTSCTVFKMEMKVVICFCARFFFFFLNDLMEFHWWTVVDV